MDFRPSKASAWLCILVAALAIRPASGQQSTDFTRPSDASSDSPLSAPDNSELEGIQAPSASSFGRHGPATAFDILPGSPAPAAVSPDQAKQWQKLLDDKKNWTMMTPEEIMGVPTAQKILGFPESDDDKNLTVEERYMKRVEKQRAASSTDALHQQDPASLDDNSDPFHQKEESAQGKKNNSQPEDMFIGIWGRQKDSTLDKNSAEKPNSIWVSAFPRPPVMPKPTVAQVAEMERFERLLGSLEPEKPPTAKVVSHPESETPDADLETMQAFNRSGKSFIPVRDTAGKPTGITPLYGLANRPPPPVKKPDPLTKPPPWMSNQIPAAGSQSRVF